MYFIYNIIIFFYHLSIKIGSFFNPKAKLWIEGRVNLFEHLKDLEDVHNIYWFHCASLGEFEQGKPIIENLKEQVDEIKILITFFSPSGFETGRKYDKADYVFYLPIDTLANAKRFVKIVDPKMAFFIKYEFWYYYLKELHHKKIPTYLISGVFRKNQLFFKWYGGVHKKMLRFFTFFFVQNIGSAELLNNFGYHNVCVTGDTRIDRVYENSLNPVNPPLIKKFTEKKKVIIAGSSWQKEEKIICEYIISTKKDFKFIIAPHDINPNHIKEIETLLGDNYIKYSDATYENIASYKTLIIDNIGILANTYQFSDIAFIGGGFTGALHNIIEPAGFANTILFGPKHEKFHEAEDLQKLNAAFEIKDTDDLIAIINHLMLENNLEKSQIAAFNYIKNGTGATKLILEELKL